MRNLKVVITFERFGISERDKSTFEVLDNTTHVQNLKILVKQFGQLFIKNGNKSVTKGRFSVICNIAVLQLTATQCT